MHGQHFIAAKTREVHQELGPFSCVNRLVGFSAGCPTKQDSK